MGGFPKFAGLLLTITLVVGGCEQRPRPWSGPPDQQVSDGANPFLYGSAASAAPSSSAKPSPSKRPPEHPASLWVNCHSGFRPTGPPRADVTRLGMMCGPTNGMTQLNTSYAGTVGPKSPARHHFEGKAGWCYRFFAATSPPISQFELRLLSSRGSRLASSSTTERWIALDPDRPVCTFEKDRFSLELLSPKHGGEYAMQIWQLPPRR